MLLCLTDEQLRALTPGAARELVIQCFYNAQREAFRRSAERIKVEASDADLRKSVENAVRFAFKAARADFEHPTKAMLQAVVQVLAAKAALLGTPEDIIVHHRSQLSRVFAALPDEARASGEAA